MVNRRHLRAVEQLVRGAFRRRNVRQRHLRLKSYAANAEYLENRLLLSATVVYRDFPYTLSGDYQGVTETQWVQGLLSTHIVILILAQLAQVAR
jgi:hypothetical protein